MSEKIILEDGGSSIVNLFHMEKLSFVIFVLLMNIRDMNSLLRHVLVFPQIIEVCVCIHQIKLIYPIVVFQ